MEHPVPRKRGVELHLHRLARRYQYGVPHGARERHAVDLSNLEDMAMEVHRMGHAGLIREDEFHPFALLDFQRRNVGSGLPIQRPCIPRHITVQGDLEGAVHGFRGQGARRSQPQLLRIRQGAGDRVCPLA
jgi:hypothetical protein